MASIFEQEGAACDAYAPWLRGMAPSNYVKLSVGDVAELRKPHACGHNEWCLLRKGVDVRIECLGCGRQVLLPREEFLGRLKRLHSSQT